jgi:hypothetical protein
MTIRERRKDAPPAGEQVRARLNPRQQGALASLENLGWVLSFVRHPLFQPPAVVVRDADGQRYAVLEDDGTINEQHGLVLRE